MAGVFLEPKVWVITSTDDQNRDIADYAGYADLVIGYQTRPGQRWSLTGRQGAQHGSASTCRCPCSHCFRRTACGPIFDFRAWSGYGETLLYYNLRTTAFRLGIEFHL